MISSFNRPSARMRFGALAAGTALALLFGQTVFARGDDANVGIDNFAFTPAVLTVKLGTIVTFENHDTMPHSIVSVAGRIRSKVMDTNDKFSVTLETAGEIVYFCGLHPYMKGKIIVAP
jgi:plastocyanin